MGWRSSVRLIETDVRRGERLRAVMRTRGECDAWEPACWKSIAELPRPVPVHTEEIEAKRRFRAYKPSLLERITGAAIPERKAHEEAILNARFRDGATSKLALDEWEWFTGLARRILEGDVDAYATAIDYLAPFQALASPKTRIEHQIESSQVVEVRASLRTSNDTHVHADRLCETALTISRTLFAYLPVDTVGVQVHTLSDSDDSLVDARSPALTVRFERNGFIQLGREIGEPHAAVRRFEHRLDYSPASAATS